MATQANKNAKSTLRSQVKARLSSLSENEITTQSHKAQNVILSLPQYVQAKRIGIYLSMPKAEAQTEILVHNALANGKKVFVPYVYSVGTEKPKRKVMDMLRLSSIDEYESLESDAWGIPKLAKEGREKRENGMGGQGLSFESNGMAREGEEVEGLDVIVVPAVAFDAQMNRLGHGAGFYDKFLSRLCGNGRRPWPFLVGLCLAEQVLPSGQLVMEEWDWRVDAVAVGDGRLLTSNDTQ